MTFGEEPVAKAQGAILAHSIRVKGGRIAKGQVLGAADIEALESAGVDTVTVAQLGPDDLDENAAAAELASGVPASAFDVSKAFTGRVNIMARNTGVLRVNAGVVTAFNGVDPMITLATLPDLRLVQAGDMVATVKIIAYGVPHRQVRAAKARLHGALGLAQVKMARASLVLTRTAGMKEALLQKGESAVRTRLARLGMALDGVEVVPHEASAIADALLRARGDLVLYLGGSATSDARDVGPAALRMAGGDVQRFGIPVDPGNLLFTGALDGRPVVGLPGCARSPALNGADWVLARLACGIGLDPRDFAAMGVGGLLKEIATRPQPRLSKPVPKAPRVAVLLLAAGASRRMQGRDKLLEDVNGIPMLRHAAQTALNSRADQVFVVVPPKQPARVAALEGLAVTQIEATDHAEGMGGSLRNGMARVMDDFDAVIIGLADMPDLQSAHYNALIDAFDPTRSREICRAVDANGTPGQPVLFGRRFFEGLSRLTGDKGARDLIRDMGEYVKRVPTAGLGASLDLDTPAEWQEWQDSAKLHR